MKTFKLTKAGLLVGAALLSTPTISAGPDPSNLLPPALTNNLFAIETDCQCILEITPNKKITIKLKEDTIVDFLNYKTGSYYTNISFSSKSIITLKDGSLIFNLSANDYYGEEDYILKLDKNDKLSILVKPNDVSLVNGSEDPDLEGLVLGFDGHLYFTDDRSDGLFKYDFYRKYVTRIAKKEDFDKLGKGFDFDIQPGISADERYIYLPSDDTPNAVFRVSYDGYKKELFAVGPNVNPKELSKETTIYLENDEYDPYLTNKKYYPGDKHAPHKPSNISGTFKLSFTENNEYYTPPPIYTQPLPWDATPSQIAKAIKKALGSKPEVRGRGTIGTPWTFNTPDGFSFNGATEYLDGASIQTFTDTDDSDIEAIEANNHIEAIGADAKYGEIKFDILANVQSSSGGNDETISDELSLSIGDNLNDIKNYIVENSQLSSKDFSVKGSGTLHSPWIFSFFGDFKNTEIEFSIENDRYDKISPEDILTGTIQDARAFDDPDGFMTRQWNGYFTLADDSSADFLYSIEPTGKVSTLVTEWAFTYVNNGSVDLEGGLAYDNKDYLYIGNGSDSDDNFGDELGGRIFKLSPSGALSIWIKGSDITKVTYGSSSSVKIEGIAFEQSTGFKSSYSSRFGF